jgi:hypothetical protein
MASTCPNCSSQLEPAGQCPNCGWPTYGVEAAGATAVVATREPAKKPQEWVFESTPAQPKNLVPGKPVVAPVSVAPGSNTSFYNLAGDQFRLRGLVGTVKREEDKRARTFPEFSETLDVHSSAAKVKAGMRILVWAAVLITVWIFRGELVQLSLSWLLLPFLIIAALGVMTGALGSRGGGAVDGLFSGVFSMFGKVFKLAVGAVNGIADVLAQVYSQAYGEYKRNQLNRKHAEKLFIVYTVSVRVVEADGSTMVRSVRLDGQFKGKPIKDGDDVELWGTKTSTDSLVSREGYNHTEGGKVVMGAV